MLPPNFTFIDQSILRPGVYPTAPEFRSGCDCPDSEDCMYDTCKCLDEVDEDDSDQDLDRDLDLDLDEDEREIIEWAEAQRRQQVTTRQRGSRDGSRDDPAAPPPIRPRPPASANDPGTSNGRLKKRFSYHTKGAKAGLLRGDKLNSPAPIYECHEGCHCDRALCPNRVVERGRQVPLQIFRTTDNRGWGEASSKLLSIPSRRACLPVTSH